MNPAQRIGELRPLLLKISVITGAPLPELEVRKILGEQLEKMLLENYPLVTIQGIEFAFRKYYKKDSFVREVNLGLFKEVLDKYMDDLAEHRKVSETALNDFKEHIWTDEDYDNDYRAKVQNYLSLLWEGKRNHLWLEQWGEVLVKDKFIENKEEGFRFMMWCYQNDIKKVYERN